MSSLKKSLSHILFFTILCGIIIGIYYSIKNQIANGYTIEGYALFGFLVYIIAFFLSLLFSDKYNFANIVLSILYLPLQLLRIILPWYQQFIYFLFALVFPAGLCVFVFRFINVAGEYNWSNELIYFVSYTLSAIVASHHRCGDFLIKITLTKRFFRRKAKVAADYDAGAIRYLIYLIYFIATYFGYKKNIEE